MKVSQGEELERQTTLTVELEPEDLESYLDRAYRSMVRRRSFPGFRKGKAPRSVVESFLGPEALLHEALDFLVPEAAQEAISQQSIETSGSPAVELVELSPVILKVSVPLLPVVKLGSYRELQIEEDPPENIEDALTKTLEQLRWEMAPWEPVERTLGFDDLATLDLTAEVEGNQIVNQEDLVYLVRANSTVPVPGFAENLEGMRQGEKRRFTLPFPGDYSDASLREKEAVFVALLKELKQRSPLPLDDEFAKGVGEGYESLDDLKERLRTELQTQAEHLAHRKVRETVLDAIVAQTHFEIPPLMIEHEIDHMLRDQEQALLRQQLSMDAYLHTLGKSQEELRGELREVALQRLRGSLVLAEVAQAEGVFPTEDDIEAEIDSLTRSSGEQADSLRQLFNTESGRMSLNHSVRTRQTLDRLVAVVRGVSSRMDPAEREENSSRTSEEASGVISLGGKHDAL